MAEKRQGIVKSFVDYFYGNFIVLLLGFISLPLITRVMSTDEYGRTSMFETAVSIIYIFAILGLDQGYIRYFYKEGINRVKLFYKCLYPAFLIILILSAVYFLFSDIFNSILFEKNGTDITLLVIGYCVTSVFERFLFLNIRMEQKGRLYSNLNIVSKVLYVSFILIFAYFLGNDFRVVLYAMTLPLMIVTGGLMIRFLYKSRHDPQFFVNSVQNADSTAAGSEYVLTQSELFKYSMPFIPMLLMEWLLTSMDKISIKAFNGLSETGVYGAAMKIMVIIATIKITFVAFWSPIAMEKYESEPEEVCKPFFSDMFDKVQLLCLSIAFGLTIFRGIIVYILAGGYRDAVRIIPFLSLMPVLSILFEMTGQGVKFTKNIKYFNYASFAAIICNLAGNMVLVPRFKGVGAAAATGITYIVYFCAGTYFSQKCYHIDYRLKKFAVSLLIYICYSAFAVCCGNQLLSAAVGIAAFLVFCLINIDTVRELYKLGISAIKRRSR